MICSEMIHQHLQEREFRRTQLDETVIYDGPLESHLDLVWEDTASRLRQATVEAECLKMRLTGAPRDRKRTRAVEEPLVDTFKRVLP
jgi:hypothetical protein